MLQKLFRSCVVAAVAAMVFAAFADDCYVATTGDDGNPGTAERPFATVAAAIGAASAGDTVHVAPGDYNEWNLRIGKAIRIVGEGADPSATVVYGFETPYSGTGRRIVYMTADATIENLTIRNGGFTTDGNPANGGNVYMNAGTITNCVISGGYVEHTKDADLGSGKKLQGALGGNLFIAGGLVVDCEIRDGGIYNSNGAGGGANVVLYNGGRLMRCRVTGGRRTSGSAASYTSESGGSGIYMYDDTAAAGFPVAENCLVAGNSGTYGAVSMGGHAKMVNCTIAGNTGGYDGYNGVYLRDATAQVIYCVLWNDGTAKEVSGEQSCFFNCAAPIDIAGGIDCLKLDGAKADYFADDDCRPTGTAAFLNVGSSGFYAKQAQSTVDLDGKDRCADGLVDLGCYEADGVPDGLVVTSTSERFGEVEPAYGLHAGYAVGRQVPCSVSAGTAECDDHLNVATCVGYKVYTNGFVYVEGSGTSFTYEHPDCVTGARLVWQWRVSKKKLPADYQQVEYIESTGKEGIDTEYLITPATSRIECRYWTTTYGRPAGASRNFATIFGVEDTSDKRFFVRYNDSGENARAYYSNSSADLNGTAVGVNTLEIAFGKNYSFVAKMNDYVNNVNQNITRDSLTASSVRIFSSLYPGYWPNNASAIRMMYFNVWETKNAIEGDVCVRKFVPCYLKGSDPLIAGFYDLYADKFYTNSAPGSAGTGLLVGPEVIVGDQTVEIVDPYFVRAAINDGTFDFSCTTENFDETPTCTWYVDGGTEPVANGQAVRLTFDTLGHHGVKVVAESGSQAATNEIVECVGILGEKIYASAGATNPVYPYATPETAVQSPKEALAIAVVPGCEIVVGEGTYAVEGIKFKTPVTLRSEKGASRTKFVAQNCGDEGVHLMTVDPEYEGGVVVDGFTIDGSGKFGAVSSYDGKSGLTFVNNVVTNCRGGAVYFYDHADNLISNCLFVGNTATEGGALLRGEGGSALYTHCAVLRNKSVSTRHGGILNDFRGTASVRNCLFAENETSFIGAGVTFGFTVNVAPGAVVENCTIVSNYYSATMTGGNPPATTNAVGFRTDGALGTVRNCIIWGNYVKGVGMGDVETRSTVTYTCSSNDELTKGAYAENHNLSADPKFRNADKGDYRLGAGSPCKGVGLMLDWMAGGVDLDGKPRVQGKKPCLGCYEARSGFAIMLR